MWREEQKTVGQPLITFWTPQGHTGNQGRPRTRWRDDLESLVKHWHRTAQNVVQWRSMGKAVSSWRTKKTTPYEQSPALSFSWSEDRGGSRGAEAGYPPPRRDDLRLSFCKVSRYVWYVLSAVHFMLLTNQKPSSYSLLWFVFFTSQLSHSLVVHPVLGKILDTPLNEVERR